MSFSVSEAVLAKHKKLLNAFEKSENKLILSSSRSVVMRHRAEHCIGEKQYLNYPKRPMSDKSIDERHRNNASDQQHIKTVKPVYTDKSFFEPIFKPVHLYLLVIALAH